MNELVVIAPVRKTVRVKAPIAHAFEVFTSGLTRWWPHDHGVGKKPIQKVLMEPRLGGRWLEISEDGTETSVATITLWEPPHRLVMLWQINAQWKPDAAMKSEVDVRFSAGGPDATRAVLTTLEEKGASYRFSPVTPGTLRSPEHLARHPFGRVPVLEHDGFLLYETQAILRYLDCVLPNPALTPADPKRAARMDQVMNVNDWYLFHNVANVIVFHRVIGPRVMGLVPDEAAIAA